RRTPTVGKILPPTRIMDSAESLHFVLAVDLSGADAADGFHGGLRQVEAAVAVVGAAVVDAHGHGFAVRGVRDLDLRTERQALVRCREFVRVEGLSVGGLPAVESVPAAVSPPPADPPLSADSAESLFFGCSGSGLGVSTFVSIVISSGSSLACFFALAKNSSVACVGSAVATAGASATTCPPGAAS